MRPLGPLPWTCARSTPSSRANLRTDGLACGLVVVSSRGSRGTGRGAVAAAGTGCGTAATGCGAAGAGVAGAGALVSVLPALPSRTRIVEPLATLSPTFNSVSYTHL